MKKCSIFICFLFAVLASFTGFAYPIHYNSIEKEIAELPMRTQRWLTEQDHSLSKVEKIAGKYKILKETFERIKEIAAKVSHTSHDALKPEWKHKNRNKNYVPFDKNRVGKDVDGFYVSGSDVVTEEQAYLITSGPTQRTAPDYFEAILLRKSPLIVTMVMPVEDGRDKCFAYWNSVSLPIETPHWYITSGEKDQVLDKGYDSHRIVKRVFVATHRKTGERRTVTQLHYENWPDGGVPDVALFQRLLDEINHMHIDKRDPITVHCSAGVGRSGTFVTCHTLYKTIKTARRNKHKEPSINIPQTILALRLQRRSMVANTYQLQFIYQMLGKM